MTLTIHHNNGNQTLYADNMGQAMSMLQNQYGIGIIVNHTWETRTPDTERLLVWASESDADDDDGSKAVAEIVRSN